MAKAIPDDAKGLQIYFTTIAGFDSIGFYEKAFGANLILKLNGPGGSIVHAEMKINDSSFMFGEENPHWGNKSAKTLGGTSAGLMFYASDCDAALDRAVAAGATVDQPPSDHFYGDRSGSVIDPSGHKWSIGTHKVDMTEAEMQAAFDDFMKAMSAPQ